jgi:nicotinamide-nucleotide amidase
MAGPRSSSPPVVVVIGVGDELLLGETVDTNGTWLSGELSRLGFQVLAREVVRDVEEEIREALGRALEKADVVLLTGGLGPTRDDLTRDVVAAYLDRGLEVSEELLAELQERFRARGFDEIPSHSRKMATVPEGATVLRNARGAAPALALETGRGLCILFPGVPREMKGLFRERAAPFLRTRFRDRLRPVHLHTVYTSGIPESVLSEEAEKVLPADTGPVSIAFLPDVRGVRIRLTARGLREEAEAEAWFSRIEEALEPVLAPYRYESEAGDLAQALGEALMAAKVKLSVAESCTGGLVAKRLTDHAGSSRFFLGGVVAYDDEIKHRLLGVDRDVLEAKGAVSGEVAEAMAKGVAGRFGTRAGIGVTGVAGPGGGTSEKPVGTVWYAALLDGEVSVRKEGFPGDRSDVRERSAQAAMTLLFRMLKEG